MSNWTITELRHLRAMIDIEMHRLAPKPPGRVRSCDCGACRKCDKLATMARLRARARETARYGQ